MKNLLSILLLATGFFFWAGCGSNEPKSTEGSETPDAKNIDYDEMAVGFCNCMRPMFDFQEQIMKLLSEGKEEEIEALRDKAIQVQRDGEACILKLEEQYGVVEGAEQEEKATAALEKACPDIMAMMGAAAESFEE